MMLQLAEIKHVSIYKVFLLLILKLIIYSIPLSYKYRKIFFGRHGRMQDPSYAKSIFDQHINLSKTKKGKSILELGLVILLIQLFLQ